MSENQDPKGKDADTKYLIVGIILFFAMVGVFLLAIWPSTILIVLGASGAAAVVTAITVVGIERVVEVMWWIFDKINAKAKADIAKKAAEDASANAADKSKAIIAITAAYNAKAADAKAADKANGNAADPANAAVTIAANAASVAADKANAAAAKADLANAAAANKDAAVADAAAATANVAAATMASAKVMAKAPQDIRRLIPSIELSIIFGLAIARIIGINIFYGGTIGNLANTIATTTTSTTSITVTNTASFSQSIGWQWGIAITGLMMGLVANPAHMLVRAIEIFKENSKNAT
jgi:hypothetical protein